ncbi:Hypothetical predicted protein [Olea europaea subsp. europaea]|uniref:Uncharacterized protein n=1 Tax=Olea europaea subsp. europaea TaxID=158383 RepID=A0A8S0SG80_OLEEU|nr:Hypothetical predicted protein [Olea europaea subsp. europaea]
MACTRSVGKNREKIGDWVDNCASEQQHALVLGKPMGSWRAAFIEMWRRRTGVLLPLHHDWLKSPIKPQPTDALSAALCFGHTFALAIGQPRTSKSLFFSASTCSVWIDCASPLVRVLGSSVVALPLAGVSVRSKKRITSCSIQGFA